MRKGVSDRLIGIGLTLCVILSGIPQSAYAQSSPEKLMDIKKLLIVSGIHEQMSYMAQNIINSYGDAVALTYPKIPDTFWDEFNGLIEARQKDDLIDRVILVYDKHMSHDVVKELIKMFDTKFWKEWKEKMPLISREAGMVGSQWGQEITRAEAFGKKIDAMIEKYELKKLNAQNEPEKKDQP